MRTDKASIARRLKLHDLRVLMSVVEAGSMGKAAERLATSQPAISRTIADLEQSLGVRLLDRAPQGVAPTPYGLALLQRSVTVFDELNLGVEDIQSLIDPAAGEVRIAAPVAPATGFVPVVIDKFSRRYPRVVCRLTTDEAAGVLRRLEEREVDLAIAFLTSIDEARMDTEVLFSTAPLVVVAAKKNPLSRRRRIQFADLMNQPWAVTPPETEYSLNPVFRSAGFDPPISTVIAGSIPARLALVARGRFLTITSEPLLRFTDYSSLKVLPVRVPSPGYNIGVVTLKNRTLTSAAKLFLHCAREVANALGTPPRRRPAGKSTRLADVR